MYKRQPEDSPDPPAWLLELRDRVRDNLPIEMPLQAEGSGELPGLIQSWIAYMLGGASAYGHSAGRSTIDRYIRVLGAALTSQLDGISIFELEIDALEIVYESTLDAQATDSKRRTPVSYTHLHSLCSLLIRGWPRSICIRPCIKSAP